MHARTASKPHTSRRPRHPARSGGAGDALYSSERRLHDGGRRSGRGQKNGGLRLCRHRRRRVGNVTPTMSTAVPTAAVERQSTRSVTPPEIRPEEELRIKMEEAGIKRPPSATATDSPLSPPTRPDPSPKARRRRSETDSPGSRPRPASEMRVKYAPEHAGRSQEDESMQTLGRGAGGTSLQFYLRNMAKTQLLKAEEEKILGRQIQKGIQFHKVREELTAARGVPPTNEEWSMALGVEVKELVSQLKRADRAKVAMINANLRLVVSVTKRYRLLGMAFTDLIQEGTFGLMRAAEKFDPERGFRFSTYAVWWIRQAAMRSVMDQVRSRPTGPLERNPG